MNGSLRELGWSDFFEEEALVFTSAHAPADGSVLEPARVVGVERASFQVWSARGQEEALLAGTLRQEAPGVRQQPVIGDWVVVQRLADEGGLRIVHVLPRRTVFARAVQGGASEQIIAANVDLVFVVTTPDEDFDVGRLARYVAAVRASGARPVVVLNKADVVEDAAPFLEQIRTLGADVPVHEVVAAQGRGLDALRSAFEEGVTVALIGSSGVGKSTLTNALLGREVAVTGAVRASDQSGRHTTTARTLYRVPGGGLLIDNPGLRDIAVWDASAVPEGASEVEELATNCRYRKCTHTNEPGCAVLQAVRQGRLSAEVLAAYQQSRGVRPRRPKKR